MSIAVVNSMKKLQITVVIEWLQK